MLDDILTFAGLMIFFLLTAAVIIACVICYTRYKIAELRHCSEQNDDGD